MYIVVTTTSMWYYNGSILIRINLLWEHALRLSGSMLQESPHHPQIQILHKTLHITTIENVEHYWRA